MNKKKLDVGYINIAIPQDVENIQMVGVSKGSDDVVVFVRFSSRSVCGSLFSL